MSNIRNTEYKSAKLVNLVNCLLWPIVSKEKCTFAKVFRSPSIGRGLANTGLGLGLERTGLGLGLDLATAGLDYKTAWNDGSLLL